MPILHFHNYKECLCLGDVVMVRSSIISPHGSQKCLCLDDEVMVKGV